MIGVQVSHGPMTVGSAKFASSCRHSMVRAILRVKSVLIDCTKVSSWTPRVLWILKSLSYIDLMKLILAFGMDLISLMYLAGSTRVLGSPRASGTVNGESGH